MTSAIPDGGLKDAIKDRGQFVEILLCGGDHDRLHRGASRIGLEKQLPLAAALEDYDALDDLSDEEGVEDEDTVRIQLMGC